MQVTDLLHAEPTELRSTHRTDHVVARTVVHLHDQHLAAGTRLYVVPVLRVLTNTAGTCSRRTMPGRTSRITSLIGMPLGLAVVAEGEQAAGTFAADERTGGTATCNYRVATVWGGTPTGVWVTQQHPTHHKVFIFGHNRRVDAQQCLDVARVHRFAALGTS